MKTNILKIGIAILLLTVSSCDKTNETEIKNVISEEVVNTETPEYFLLRPEIENAFNSLHAIKNKNNIKISGAVSVDNKGNPSAVGNLEQQMINCYADLEKILDYYDCTFDDVVVEKVFTTNMPEFLEVAAYRNEIYTTKFPTSSWHVVEELATPEFMIEIELVVHETN
ncbi:Rid family hydrolase [uncultured Flavobacterium sp.]|uniref:RidA family protein n=1 Tax=uncultured Flavobacterium sp. TaxID=165435 RepID=UPI0030EB7456|tara:strand:- start:162768 stop:163274 length:507 start_codon:yes stop_codon:yes gene_type:complete